MRFGSTAKVLLKCKLKYYRISEWDDVGQVAKSVHGGPNPSGLKPESLCDDCELKCSGRIAAGLACQAMTPGGRMD